MPRSMRRAVPSVPRGPRTRAFERGDHEGFSLPVDTVRATPVVTVKTMLIEALRRRPELGRDEASARRPQRLQRRPASRTLDQTTG
jgi:hypothetical protein